MIRRSDDPPEASVQAGAPGSVLRMCTAFATGCWRLAAALLLIISSPDRLIAQQPVREELRWFQDAKLGIFIHWGIYSVNGVDESWAFYNKKMSHADYMQQLQGFTARNYDAGAWADLIKRSGAKYAVITTKHHDGVQMWGPRPPRSTAVKQRSSTFYRMGPVKVSSASSRPGAPKEDLLSQLFAELRQRDMKCGAYFSLIDWSAHDYPAFLKDSTRYAIKADPARWQRFRNYYQGQINEIATQLKPDLWWFDGDWEHSAEEWEAAKVRAMILEKNPKAIINGRLQGFGDYATPEQNIPVETPVAPAWELCMTIGDQWGWQPQDTNYKSTHDLIAIFADVIGHGGNLLLDIAPKESGTIPEEQVARLEDLGKWTSKHAEAIYGTRAGLPHGHFFGPSTLSPDSTTLYLFLANGMSGSIEIKGLVNKIRSAEVVRDAGSAGLTLKHRVVGKITWSQVPGLVFIDVPAGAADPWMTVVKVELEGTLKLYRGQGGF